MGTLIIDKKKFIVIEQKEFEKIQLLAAKKTAPAKKLSLTAGKKHALKLIDKWASKHPGTCSYFSCRNCLVY
jgi:hypothetical protein